MDLTVSEASAIYFYEQCVGTFDGHMAAIPNNPVLRGLCLAHGVKHQDDFVRFLRQVAEQLGKEQPF
ncbi:MAG: hypothetical protein KAJ19_03615 [Gammaproteobacteria bacterium]|nr:hypothetical protein [Gammaproteobacteria bacterium]